ncbi:regulatory factor X-associated protein [Gymnodraco acuticeps]|uniref:Regulatory factor X-associated protein n=2 Tax=Notothenioidei TaxID=8205 RepID=A0A6P8SXI6_GYMAC|nr:PREDICTED: regulatory factor X-associated protein [Notothenia coriiceps]XP_034055379.1 regulatory factor X-associated protein [Gymnodraco acuticeps]XP_034055380.1 regulatory factor X-associated protein [Gymnodraco acuticeps]XP_034055381.1 regulatory factor X-associated protein [Gymnodraco acuticeps]
MSEDDNSASANRDRDSTLLLTKDGQRYYVSKSGVVDSRNVITPHEPDNNASSYDMDDMDEESDVLDTSDPRDSAASPEELNDDETSEGDSAPKQCTYDGCTETTTQVAKQRKPWMCKKHRNKMYKDKYKKKKNDQAMSTGKIDENSEERPVSVNKQRLGAMGDRPTRPSLIEQVLNQKRLSLLRSPEVISFLQQQQQLLASQSRSQAQQQFPGC